MSDVIVMCVCGQKNRVPPTWQPGMTLRCGKCKFEGIEPALDNEDLDEEDEDA